MNEQIFFEYLIGNWMIKRKIVNRLSSSFCADACGHEGVLFMFNLFFDPKLKILTKGQYQSIKDCYFAKYKIINHYQSLSICFKSPLKPT